MAIKARVAAAKDLPSVVETITVSFMDDPVWSWIFPDPSTRADVYRRWWPSFVRGALEHGWVRVTPGCEAVAVWLPPGAAEFTEADEQAFDQLVIECAGPRADLVHEGIALFEANRPSNKPHFYLSLFGTHSDHRGQGLGMALLRENLELIDAEGLPAYLESTNSANLARYRSVGFEKVGEFAMPQGGPVITTMWRAAR